MLLLQQGDDAGHGYVIMVKSKTSICPCKEICIPVSLATRAPLADDPSVSPTFRCACNNPADIVSPKDSKSPHQFHVPHLKLATGHSRPLVTDITCIDPALNISEFHLSSRHFIMLVISTVIVFVIVAFFVFVGSEWIIIGVYMSRSTIVPS